MMIIMLLFEIWLGEKNFMYIIHIAMNYHL